MATKFSYFFQNLFWGVNRPCVILFLQRKFNFVMEKGSDPIPNRPFVMIGNHANFFDPWFVGVYSRFGLSIMMNDDGFRGSKLTKWYLEAIGAFAKKKGAHDYTAMKKTLNLLRNGYPVLIFPEGQTSWDGETQPLYGGIEKIVKRGRCPLVMMNLHGNFLTRPWWSETSRRGRIGIRAKVLQPEEMKAQSDPELLDTIKTYLYNNDVKNEENRKVPFVGKDLAKGLERFMWICRHCQVEDALVTNGNTVTCTACSATWEMDAHCRFKPLLPAHAEIGDLHDWSLWHKEQVKAKLTAAKPDDILTTSDDVHLSTEDENSRFMDQAKGRLTLTPLTIKFTPENGETLRWVRSEISDYVIQKKDILEFRADGKYYRYVFSGHSPMKWIFYLRYMDGFAEIEERGYY